MAAAFFMTICLSLSARALLHWLTPAQPCTALPRPSGHTSSRNESLLSLEYVLTGRAPGTVPSVSSVAHRRALLMIYCGLLSPSPAFILCTGLGVEVITNISYALNSICEEETREAGMSRLKVNLVLTINLHHTNEN